MKIMKRKLVKYALFSLEFSIFLKYNISIIKDIEYNVSLDFT